ncbi:hypothetical protein [uncultured Croceitalea sp.]|uniref:hypothetical protein n=1 Tax=uncultured Croceitalea sp. TaxID=1798908 RepID=UPI003305EAA4
MDNNALIKNNLEHLSAEMIKSFNENPLSKRLRQELDNFGNTNWVSLDDSDLSVFKEEYKSKTVELLNDSELHSELYNLSASLVDIRNTEVQNKIEYQLLNNLSNIASTISNTRSNNMLNLLFLEHDYEYQACFCGFDDKNYHFKLLSGEKYLEYNYEKELFNGLGNFDYSPILSPILNFEEKVGQKRVDDIYENLCVSSYIEEIKELHLLNAYLGIHICLCRIENDFRKIKIPMMDKVYIFGNEHDCEQLNIYVLEN